MKIGIQIEHLDKARGGAETYTWRLACALLRHGHEVHIFTRDWSDEPEGAVMHHILPRGITRWRKFVSFAQSCAKAAEQTSLDVVLALGRTFGADVLRPAGGTAQGSQRQNLLRVRSPLVRLLKALWDGGNIKRIMLRRIEARQFSPPVPQLVAVSRMVRDDLIKFYGVPEDHLHVVPNGVDTDYFSPAGMDALRGAARQALEIPEGATVFCLVAHNFDLKGLREFIEAAALVRREREDFRLLVVGRGRRGPFRRLGRQLGCDRELIFAGPVADVRPMYAACDVFVHPTWYDPCSLVVLEALGCGRPVITTRFNGASELLTDGVEGFVIDTPADVGGLAKRMLMLFDASLRAKMGAEARRLAEEHTFERNFAGMMSVFEKVVRLKREKKE